MISLNLLQKRAILLISHHGCNIVDLYNNLLKTTRINGFTRKITKRASDYDDPVCGYLFNKNHNWPKKDKIYLDVLLFNYQISCKELYKNKNVEFIYYLGNGISTIKKIIQNTGLDEESARRYYCFRLRRICEMMEKTPNSMIFIEGMSTLENLSSYLNQKYNFYPKIDINYSIKLENSGISENCFERYYAFIQDCNEKKFLKII
jgi:hypothetical protein